MKSAVSLQTACLHCGTLFLPAFSEAAATPFCCAGCSFVYNLIQDQGLNQYYQIKNANPPACPTPAHTSSQTYEFCDDSEFVKNLSSDGRHIRFYLDGLNCTACLWLLEKLPEFCKDAAFARINMSESIIEVERTPKGSFAAIARTLDRFGYRPHPLSETEGASHLQKKERRRDLIRIGVAAAGTGNIMILAVSLYGGATGTLANEFRWLSALLSIPVLTYCAWPFYWSALRSLRSRRLNIDVPIVAALISGVMVSVWGLLSQRESIYFDSLSMLVFLLLSSRFALKAIQSRQFHSSHLENEMLLTTVIKINSAYEKVNMSSLSLTKGDLIEVNEASSIPVDGFIENGRGLIDTSVMTGETEPIEVGPGKKIEAGTRNLMGVFHLRVENPPAQSRLAQILKDTERAAQSKSHFVHLADKAAQWFLGLVFLIALGVALTFLWTDPVEGFSRALALIIVTCPCVFGIAIPLSMGLAMKSARQSGIIIKNPDAIEKLWKCDTLFFDKTGTLTTGEMSVVEAKSYDPIAYSVALALEQNQPHPVGRTISKYLKAKSIPLFPLSSVDVLPLGGVASVVHDVCYSVKPIPTHSRSPGINHQSLLSHYAVFKNLEKIAEFELGDQPRKGASQLLNWARRHQFKINLLSGDRHPVVARLANLLEFKNDEFRAELSPEQKAELVRAHKDHSVMIGDGANDASALASASVGIAVCGSLDVSLRAADIYLTRPDLSGISTIIQLSKATQNAIWRNLIFSASFNILSGALAILGLMTPLWAAVLMPLSSTLVLISALWTAKQFERHPRTLVVQP